MEEPRFTAYAYTEPANPYVNKNSLTPDRNSLLYDNAMYFNNNGEDNLNYCQVVGTSQSDFEHVTDNFVGNSYDLNITPQQMAEMVDIVSHETDSLISKEEINIMNMKKNEIGDLLKFKSPSSAATTVDQTERTTHHAMPLYGKGKQISMLKKVTKNENKDQKKTLKKKEQPPSRKRANPKKNSSKVPSKKQKTMADNNVIKPSKVTEEEKVLYTSSDDSDNEKKVTNDIIANDIIANDSDNDNEADSEDKESVADNEEPSAAAVYFQNKNCGRYKKNKIDQCVDLEKRKKLKTEPAVDPKTFQLFNKYATKVIDTKDADEIEKNDYRFSSYMAHQGYYMYIVSKHKDPAKKFKISYINCVASVTTEYAVHYSKIDHMVMVLTLDRVRFLISYELLRSLNIEIPNSEDLLGQKEKNPKKCYFNEVKDFVFKTLLINTFQLDLIYVQIKTILMFSALGEEKTKRVLEMTENLRKDELFSRLPVNLYRPEASKDDVPYEMTPYVHDVLKHSAGLKFKKMTRPENSDEAKEVVMNELKYWLKGKDSKDMKEIKNEGNYFTYKYGSIIRLLYQDSLPAVKNLTKVRKSCASAHVIENYLEASAEAGDNDNCLLLSTKDDERITIIKKGYEYVWITSVIKDIIPSDIINTFKKHTHYIFNLNKTNRKAINNKHNGLIKLMCRFTSDYLTFDEVRDIAVQNFECNFKKIEF
ncbi:ie-1 [Sucra jujuba nucleopolyhedrovirus]|uniref:Ie-1 n=1 Tax=Sucra jujuba nucleopolyhedrovirus TaxID=1563660 RepID=A0A097P8V4_9ABAC|nr:ie-1 [Sucra jujuba nucleopolyhedrovirus]AIU41262.1 ie-1 [Sucra jujuba nucleopolyhedrovirus]